MININLDQISKRLVASGKGILAADESAQTCQKRFDSVGVECTEETRLEYRELLLTTPGAHDYMSGVILYDETFWQSTGDKSIPQYLEDHGVQPGIKVDKGLINFPGFPDEKITQGLDGLPEQMTKYAQNSAKFAKWRAVITIAENTPTKENIEANTFILARYARICQEVGIVPIVEPEVLFDGTHSIEDSEKALEKTLDALFANLKSLRVDLSGTILKTSMVLPGKNSGVQMNHDEVAEKTVGVLHEHVPPELGGVVFLSGGQTSKDAFINLNRIAKLGTHPWGVTFSYSRAIQDPVLKLWAKNREDKKSIQDLFLNQLKLASAASLGELDEKSLKENTEATKSQDL